MKKQIRIIIVDDHQMVRETWRLLLEQDERFSIIAECSDGAEAIDAANTHKPDIILMDINMYPVNGFDATKKIIKEIPSARVIAMSLNNQPIYVRNMLRAGAKGYITKNSSKEEMTTAILEVYEGKQYICEEVKAKI
jgi:two-component system invasion response regulator UvrY